MKKSKKQDWAYSDTKVKIDKIPDPKLHQQISFIKSGIRILGYAALWWSIDIAATLLILSEVVGVYEELEEYKEACEKGDIVGILDALCDITYVSLGNGALLHGLKGKIWKAYQEVQASNMSKSCETESEAKATVTKRSEEKGHPCHYEKIGDRYIVYRSSDRKVMKSINYFAPDLKQFFTDEELKNI